MTKFFRAARDNVSLKSAYDLAKLTSEEVFDLRVGIVGLINEWSSVQVGEQFDIFRNRHIDLLEIATASEHFRTFMTHMGIDPELSSHAEKVALLRRGAEASYFERYDLAA